MNESYDPTDIGAEALLLQSARNRRLADQPETINERLDRSIRTARSLDAMVFNLVLERNCAVILLIISFAAAVTGWTAWWFK